MDIKIRPLVHLLLVGIFCWPSLGSIVQADLPPAGPGAPLEPQLLPGGAPESETSALKDAATRAAAGGPIRRRIDIAISAADDKSPAVAQCAGGQYLVVYECDAIVFGRRLDVDGDLLGDAFVISEDARDHFYPDVACDWYTIGYPDDVLYGQAAQGSHATTGMQLDGGRTVVGGDFRRQP